MPGRGRRLPTRVLARRASLLGACTLALGCASGERPPEPALGSLWSEYRELPEHRALAMAGELRRSRWVAGVSGGNGTRAEAESRALEACAERRLRLRIKDFCRLYAVGDEIVWPGGW